MQQFDLSLLPTAVDITLYRYNYIDNKLWAQIHNDVDFIETTEDSIMISSSQLEYLLKKYYSSILNKIKTVGSEVFHKEINTVYFLHQMVLEMDNLQYIKFNLNFDKSYNRTILMDDKTVLQFGFKVITATLRLSDLYDDEELEIVNGILEKLSILAPNEQYTRIFAKDLADSIDLYMMANENDEDEIGDEGIIADILDILENKLEPENTLILLITDY